MGGPTPPAGRGPTPSAERGAAPPARKGGGRCRQQRISRHAKAIVMTRVHRRSVCVGGGHTMVPAVGTLALGPRLTLHARRRRRVDRGDELGAGCQGARRDGRHQRERAVQRLVHTLHRERHGVGGGAQLEFREDRVLERCYICMRIHLNEGKVCAPLAHDVELEALRARDGAAAAARGGRRLRAERRATGGRESRAGARMGGAPAMPRDAPTQTHCRARCEATQQPETLQRRLRAHA